jgi:glycosyltransferase involved in cell wall biosynthesis
LKKIIFVLGYSRIAGTEVQTLNLSEELLMIGIETELWILEKKGKLDDLSQTNLRIIHYPILDVSWLRKIHNFARLVLAIQQNKKAIFQTQLPAPSILIYFAQRFFNNEITRIVGIRGKIENRGLVAELILKKCFKSANGIIVNSPHLLNEALSRFQLSESHIEIIPNGVKPGNKIANTTIQPARIVVLANFISYKGHSLLIDAIEKSSIKNHYTFYHFWRFGLCTFLCI